MEIHCLHQKVDYKFTAEGEVMIRLFKLEESLRFIEETLRV